MNHLPWTCVFCVASVSSPASDAAFIQGPYRLMHSSLVCGCPAQTTLLNRVKSKAIHFIHSLSSDAAFTLWQSVAMLHFLLSCTVTVMVTALTNLLVAGFPRLGTPAHPCSSYFTNARIERYLHSFILSLSNSGTPHYSVFPLNITRTPSREEYQHTPGTEWIMPFF